MSDNGVFLFVYIKIKTQGSTFMEHKRQNKTNKPMKGCKHKYMYIFFPISLFINTYDCDKWYLICNDHLCDCVSKYRVFFGLCDSLDVCHLCLLIPKSILSLRGNFISEFANSPSSNKLNYGRYKHSACTY